jgi:hypothetical protein
MTLLDIVYALMFLTWQLLAKWLAYMIKHRVFLPFCNRTLKLDDTCLFTWFVEWSILIMSKFVCYLFSQMSNVITHLFCGIFFSMDIINWVKKKSHFCNQMPSALLIYFALLAWLNKTICSNSTCHFQVKTLTLFSFILSYLFLMIKINRVKICLPFLQSNAKCIYHFVLPLCPSLFNLCLPCSNKKPNLITLFCYLFPMARIN